MPVQKTQFLLDEEEPMQKDLFYLSTEENTETQSHKSDQHLTNGHNECWLNQVQIHPNEPLDTVEVTILSVDADMPTLSHSPTTDPQQEKNSPIMSPVSDDIFFQPGLHLLDLLEPKKLRTKDSPDSLTPSNKGPTQLFKPYDLPNTPPTVQRSWATPK